MIDFLWTLRPREVGLAFLNLLHLIIISMPSWWAPVASVLVLACGLLDTVEALAVPALDGFTSYGNRKCIKSTSHSRNPTNSAVPTPLHALCCGLRASLPAGNMRHALRHQDRL